MLNCLWRHKSCPLKTDVIQELIAKGDSVLWMVYRVPIRLDAAIEDFFRNLYETRRKNRERAWRSASVRNRNLFAQNPTWRQGYENGASSSILLCTKMWAQYYGLYDRTTRRQRKRRFKNEFAFFRFLLRLFQLTYFAKCRRPLPELNF